MDPEAEAVIKELKRRRAQAQEQRAALEEVDTELRQAVLEYGVDQHLLRQFEISAVDLAINRLTLQNMDALIKNTEEAAEG